MNPTQDLQIPPTSPIVSPNQNKAPVEKKTSRPVLGYIGLLFMAACCLILLSYCMHDRSNQAAIDQLQNSVSSLQSMAALQAESASLLEENMALEKSAETLNNTVRALEEQANEQAKALSSAESALSAASIQLEKVAQAMDWLTELSVLRAAGKNSLARESLREFEASGLPDYLPTTPLRQEQQALSPAQRYANLVEALR